VNATRAKLSGLLVAALLLAPRAALACPVCTGGQKAEVGRAFLVGSVALSVLPLLAAGAAAWWLRRRARSLAASSATAAAHAPRSWLSQASHPLDTQ
jgi:hypothetical protein